jgi:hypothetical protein
MLESEELTPDRVRELRTLLDDIARKAHRVGVEFKTEENRYDAP